VRKKVKKVGSENESAEKQIESKSHDTSSNNDDGIRIPTADRHCIGFNVANHDGVSTRITSCRFIARNLAVVGERAAGSFAECNSAVVGSPKRRMHEFFGDAGARCVYGDSRHSCGHRH
jgi:hypothetical protein